MADELEICGGKSLWWWPVIAPSCVLEGCGEKECLETGDYGCINVLLIYEHAGEGR